jgi:predicted amidohydrolase
MKICIAQTRAVKGDIEANLANHKKSIELAAAHGAKMIIFSELSLTGYEPELADALATNKDDERFNELQQVSDEKNIVIGAGIPVRSGNGILIGMVIFRPLQSRQTYFKQYLHPDEEPYFITGPAQKVLEEINDQIALAICYEISVPEHAERAHENEAKIYIASVAKTVDGMEKAFDTLAATAKKYSMFVLVSNCVGECEGKEAGGRSAIWNDKGTLLEQLNDKDEGIFIFDTSIQEIIKEQKVDLLLREL